MRCLYSPFLTEAKMWRLGLFWGSRVGTIKMALRLRELKEIA